MSSRGIESNLMSVASNNRPGSPASNSSRQKSNPRRTSPEASVSLRHGVLSSSAAEPNKAFAIPPKLQHGDPSSHRGPSATQFRRTATSGKVPQSHDPVIGTEVSQQMQQMQDTDRESAFYSNKSIDRSVPDDWFKNWNNNVGDFNRPNIADGDSPYYLPSEKRRRKLKNQPNPSTKTAPGGGGEIVQGGRIINQNTSASIFNPTYPSMLPTQDSEDESDVYRSVIDDLTIKNKKLKKKLRKMERLHCNELNEEKLFEVRCYGLPPSRKQELQELLQKFAGGLEGNGGVYETKRSDAISNANAASSTNPSSSSLLQNTDSAYATETRMTSLDGGSVDVSKVRPPLPGQIPGRPRTLSTTGPNLEPRPIQFANERIRMKLVVRRLEQLFTGSDALQSEMEKSTLQQQLAVAAAAEKQVFSIDEMAESGDEDDKREAALMSHQQDDDLSKGQSQDQRPGIDATHQRPTRPIDLDPNRAQVAADNVEYLEQMSHSSSHKHYRPVAPGETTGWVYLNLINNMAQIHTLNVSLSFIKKSIRSMSDKLELSPDGNKVRWRGGLTGTRLSSDGDTSSGVENSSTGDSSPGEGKLKSMVSPQDVKPSARATSNKGGKSRSSPHSSPVGTPANGVYNTADNFRYRPLIFHTLGTQKSSSAESSDQGSSDSGSEPDTNNSGGPPPIVESGSNIGIGDISKFAPLDGPVIYFGGSPFCTDLSAQVVFRDGGHSLPRNGEASSYTRLVDEPIGPPSPIEEEHEEIETRPLSKFDWSSQDDEMRLDETSDERLPELTSIMATASDILPSAMPPPYSFEASGLAGIRPEDNFVAYVKTVQKPVRSRKFRVKKPQKIYHSIPMEALNAFTENSSESSDEIRFENDILDVIQIRLQPSKLPDPALVFSLSEGSSDPFLSSTDEPRSYESHLSFAYNIESDSRSSGEGIPSFHSPDLDDQSPMDLDAEEGIPLDHNPLAPLSVVATAGSEDGNSVASPKEIPILKSLDDMDIGSMDLIL
ncbi:hypothetical protein H072_1306 [Dactylellina haptotyla CBS 200.50]|uniref:Frequency clock protein n=1 Tax=Dactylellina haptotyla (strain CBS 200.50) TaxID=1284197 RepID=S8CAE7_DACHA|nr:hypothetical protein H072_1306 [Dactylellina haptotyla CBS 200.50]